MHQTNPPMYLNSTVLYSMVHFNSDCTMLGSVRIITQCAGAIDQLSRIWIVLQIPRPELTFRYRMPIGK